MPRTSVSETNRSNDQPDQFPKLKLKTGEVARLLVVDDENAWMEWVHSMRAPVIGESGKAVMTNKKRKNGDLYEDYDMGFVGQRICLGDPSVVEDKEVDPARCPACQAAADGIQDMKPVRRFAVPVIRYKAVKPSVTSGASPSGCTTGCSTPSRRSGTCWRSPRARSSTCGWRTS
jgi:hypothetical protein